MREGASFMPEQQLRILAIGAHPDDADIKAGGTASKWCRLAHLERSPVILYFSDAFTKPCRFEPHVVVDIEAEFDRLIGMLDCHESQFYEWLPFNAGYLDQVPAGKAERRRWLAERIGRRLHPL